MPASTRRPTTPSRSPQTATGIAFTPIVGVYQNNQITTSAGISATYAATAKISTFASARYYRAHQLNLVVATGTRRHRT